MSSASIVDIASHASRNLETPEVLRSKSSSVGTASWLGSTSRVQSPASPPLPNFAEREADSERYTSPPQVQQGSDNSAYYTALWGSPYDLPPSSKRSPKSHNRWSTNSTSDADSSPLRSVGSTGLESVSCRGASDHRTRNSFSDSPLRASKPQREPKRPHYSFTQDWLKSRRTVSEKENWLSDESEDSKSELGSAVKEFGKDKNHWLGLDHGDGSDIEGSRVNKSAARNFSSRPDFSGTHQARPSDATLRQEDFDKIFRSIKPEESKILAAMMQGAMPRRGTDDGAEKPLPPPPANRTASEAPIVNAAEAQDGGSSHVKRPSVAAGLSYQRPKKRVMWHGKTCVIALPLDEGDRQKRKFLVPDAVVGRLNHWEQNGFNTIGFDLAEENEGHFLPHGQSRDLYPDPLEMTSESRARHFRVRIPDRESWQNYVKQLQEEKLRALGVSFGDEAVPARLSPTQTTMSRQNSLQRMPFITKPGAPLSTNNVHNHHEDPFSPPLSYPSSVVSPGPQQLQPLANTFHMPRQSMAFPHQPPYGPGNHFFSAANASHHRSPCSTALLSNHSKLSWSFSIVGWKTEHTHESITSFAHAGSRL